ncbi:L,D-transpeptidase [Streptomyces synnematoformans]|uniref:Ig-like domain-containing protein n=1 Tax=Streptomyces synnematoformans TaxID=415721 RepID=A0ABN2XZQ5_9ACTN
MPFAVKGSNDVRVYGKGRRGVALSALAMSAVLGLTACSGDSKADDSGDRKDQAAEKAADREKDVPDARISIAPKDGAENVGINSDTKVTVKSGKLTEVTLTAVGGSAETAGTIADDGRSWTPDVALERGTEYRITAKAKDADGQVSTSNTHFTTVSAENSVIGYFTPEDGSTVGVGMPVSLNFDKPVEDKAAVESKIDVETSSGQDVVGHWFNDTRLDFRPEDYWQAGSTVTMDMNLDGVEASPGVYGVQDREMSFTVGRSQVSTVDVKAKTMIVERNGKMIKTVPISAGAPDTPTYNGTMVISEKHKETRMDGSTVDFVDENGESEYDIPDVPHAMRLSTSGTFIHGNYWGGQGVFGSANTSHGCVGLFDKQGADDPGTDGAWFYDQSLLGDVVIVKNSPDETIAPDNGLNGWNMDWAAWQAGSAL